MIKKSQVIPFMTDNFVTSYSKVSYTKVSTVSFSCCNFIHTLHRLKDLHNDSKKKSAFSKRSIYSFTINNLEVGDLRWCNWCCQRLANLFYYMNYFLMNLATLAILIIISTLMDITSPLKLTFFSLT